MAKIKNILLNTLKDFGYKAKEVKNSIVFTNNDNYIAKVFFHDNTMDFVVTYKSALTDSGNRNLVLKGLKSGQELYGILDDMITGVELSKAALSNLGKVDPNTVSADTFNRYNACVQILPVANTLSFVA